MSTRGAIVRFTNKDNKKTVKFAGRYHHWDSYPAGLGATLWNLYHGYFNKNIEKMLGFLIDEHPAGWDNINDRDFSLAPGFQDRNKRRCIVCGEAMREHYCPAKDHLFEETQKAVGPECLCHGDLSNSKDLITNQRAIVMGCEWVYGFDEHTLVILCLFHKDGTRIGMFGIANPTADPKAVWKEVARIPLNGSEPDWEYIENNTREVLS